MTFNEQVAKICNQYMLSYDAANKLMDIANRADEVQDTLGDLMQYVGGWDENPSHPCGKAVRILSETR